MDTEKILAHVRWFLTHTNYFSTLTINVDYNPEEDGDPMGTIECDGMVIAEKTIFPSPYHKEKTKEINNEDT